MKSLELEYHAEQLNEVLQISEIKEKRIISVLRGNGEVELLDRSSGNRIWSYKFDHYLQPVSHFWLNSIILIIIFEQGGFQIIDVKEPSNPLQSIGSVSGTITSSKLISVKKPVNQNETELSYILGLACDDGQLEIYNCEDFSENFKPEFYFKCSTNVCEEGHFCVDLDISLAGGFIFGVWTDGKARCLNINKKGQIEWTSLLTTDSQLTSCSVYNELHFLVGGSQGKVWVLNTAYGVVIQEIQQGIGSVLCFAVDLANDQFAFSGQDSRVFLHKKEKNGDECFQKIGQTRGHTHDVKTLYFEQEYSRLYSGGINSDVCIYELNNSGFSQLEEDPKIHWLQGNFNKVDWVAPGLGIIKIDKSISLIKIIADEDRILEVDHLLEFRSDYVYGAITASKDGMYLALASATKRDFRVINVETGKNEYQSEEIIKHLFWQDDNLMTINIDGDVAEFSKDFKLCKKKFKIPNFNLEYESKSLSCSGLILLSNLYAKKMLLINSFSKKVDDLSFLISKIRIKGVAISQLSIKDPLISILGIDNSLFCYSPAQKKQLLRISDKKKTQKIGRLTFLSSFTKNIIAAGFGKKLVKFDLTSKAVNIETLSAQVLSAGLIGKEGSLAFVMNMKEMSLKLPPPVFTKRYISNNL